MNNTKEESQQASIDQLKELVDEIKTGLFCTNLKTDNGASCRPMNVQNVCAQGNIWFFSDVQSDKNREIKDDRHVRLYFSHPGKSSYLIVNGEADIRIDKKKTEELWTPLAETWFPGGKDDPAISIIKVKPTTAYYWDNQENRMINLYQTDSPDTTENPLVSGLQAELNVRS